jgi:hypothetical protein
MSKLNLKDILLIALIGVLCFLSWKLNKTQNDSIAETEKLRKSIIANDKLLKEKDGQYAKLVNYYKSQRDLINELKSTNGDLYKTIKKQDERLLSLTNVVISMDKKVVGGFAQADPVDSSKLNLALKYPDEKDPFIFWDGWVNKNTAAYRGTFSFGKLPISIVLTEESRGLWKSRLVGPEWLKVDSMSISSLPPEEYSIVKPKNLQWMVGGTYYTGKTPGFGVNLGINLYQNHNVIVGANTMQQVSFTYCYKIKSLKRKK